MRPPAPRPEKHEPAEEAALAPAEVNRRQALQLLGAGAALGAAGCLREPGEDIRPYAQVPPELHPGTPTFYATSLVEDGFAAGVIVETHEGRPTKLDGHPRHPASLGGSTAAQQAALFGLYDPHRARLPSEHGVPTAWSRALAALAAPPPPGPLWLVLPPASSPTIAALLARVAERHPGTQVVTVGGAREGVYRGAALAYGAPLEVQLDLRRADRLVAFDADPLAEGPMAPRLARDFAARRRPARPEDDPGRVWVAEPMPTPTGTIADHRLAVPAGDVLALVVTLAAALARRGVALPWRLPERLLAAAAARVDGAPRRRAWVDALAEDLAGTRGASALVVGARQPPACHALVHGLNAALGNVGRAVTLTAPALIDPLGGRRLADLAQAIAAREVGTVVILDVNPVYQAPPALGLAAALARVPLAVHLTRHVDETARACRWVLPATHDLEAWGDARAADGTLSFAQPLVRPLVPARSAAELLAALAGGVQADGRALLRAQHAGRDLDALLGEGFDGASAFAPAAATLGDGAAVVAALDEAFAAGPASPAALELALARSPTIGDGRLANHAWLQELPHPITKQTWGNAALVSPATAARLHVQDGQLVRLRAGERSVLAPVLAVPGHADGSVTLELGHGRDAPDEAFAHGLGASGFALLGDDERARLLPGLLVEPTDGHAALARTQGSFSDDGRGLAPHADLATWRRDPRLGRRHEPLPTMLPERHAPPSASATTPTLQWAMTIDTTICTGCSACVIACQAENNIPSVGAAEVRRGREMHWLRIDSYWYDDPGAATPTVVHQPMLCQHCEHAPCEYVCPVFATEHSPDGLNEMVYNRCVGTRFCSNNCPYKVRRFNWRGYTRGQGTLALQRNPDVTVRQRGVMEKCTYCVQRIRGAEIRARVEKRAIAPSEVVTACQAACPTGAIAFGALEHADGEMARRRGESRRYAVLEELGTRPRTLYLAKIANPYPELAPAAPGAKP